jgi:uncharacterized membrane protein
MSSAEHAKPNAQDDDDEPQDRRIIVIAISLAVAYLGVTCLAGDSHFGDALRTTLALHVPAGAVVSLATCLAMDAGYGWTVLANAMFCYTELAFLIVLIEHGDQLLRRVPFLRRMRERMERRADKHKDHIKRWGVPGLFAFVAIPVFMSGPWVGVFLGHAIKMKNCVILLAVGTGSSVSMSFVCLLLTLGGEFIPFHAAPLMIWGVILLVIGIAIWLRWHRRRAELARELAD